MILWTIQPVKVWSVIRYDGVYRCKPALSSVSDPNTVRAYNWLADSMAARIGAPPRGAIWPVWAWYMRNGKRAKPDLRAERWRCGPGNEEFTCLEIDVPADRVVLSDFDVWHIILNDSLISTTEEEHLQLEAWFYTLPPMRRAAYQQQNWARVFDVTPFENDWMMRGKWIQATFWELRREQVRNVRTFKTAAMK